MPNTNSWLCQYAIAQIGRPYWYATNGQVSSMDLYNSVVLPGLKASGYSQYTNASSQLGVKVHDCSGLVLGALMCDNFNDPPVRGEPIPHRATLQYTESCNPKGSMATFPKIPGTLVFRSNGSNKQHVGIYIGKFTSLEGVTYTDAVIDARSHDSGVVVNERSAYKGGWDCWGQLAMCEKDTDSNTTFDANTILQPAKHAVSSQKLEVSVASTTPYIATVLAGYNPNIDYDKLKAARVSGMMFYGGQLFTASHTKQTYVNGYLGGLTQKCNDAGMPYALYVNVRARNVIEADAECRALYYVVSRYSPKLGLWLSLQTGATIKSVNDAILEVYYKYIYKWGLAARCGLYVTQAQLNTITWDSFKERFYLWGIADMNVSEIDDDILNPNMFEVPD